MSSEVNGGGWTPAPSDAAASYASALRAILARVGGLWNDADLRRWGAPGLVPDAFREIEWIARSALVGSVRGGLDVDPELANLVAEYERLTARVGEHGRLYAAGSEITGALASAVLVRVAAVALDPSASLDEVRQAYAEQLRVANPLLEELLDAVAPHA